MGNSDELYVYVNTLVHQFELQAEIAEGLAEAAKENAKDMKWVKAELLDIIEKEEQAMDSITSCSVYYITNAEMSMVKIGISNNVANRISNMQTSTGYYLELAKEIKFDTREEALKCEEFLHREFSEYNRKPNKIHKTSEWFDIKILKTLLALYDTKEKIQAAMEREMQELRNAMENIHIDLG